MNDGPILLRGDAEIIEFLEDVDAQHDGSEVVANVESVVSALRRVALEQPQQALVRFGRALRMLADRNDELARYRRNVVEEIDAERADVQARMTVLDRIFVEEALFRRENGGPKSLRVPTIGTWNSRAVDGGWTLPADEALIAGMEEADKPLFVHKVEAEKVEREAFRAHIEALVDTQMAEELGADSTEAEHDAAEQRARDEIAERYGIQWRAPRISVKGPFSA